MTHEPEEHEWHLASWSSRNDYSVGVFICDCGGVKRMIYDPKDVQIVDPENLQGVHEHGRVGVWTGE